MYSFHSKRTEGFGLKGVTFTRWWQLLRTRSVFSQETLKEYMVFVKVYS